MTSTQDADLKPTLAALVDKHAERLNAALAAIAGRGYWSAYPESPSPRVYGEGTAEAGKAAFEAHLGKPFGLGQPGADGQAGGEVSPYGLDLGVSYEHLGADALIAAATAATPGWRAAGPRVRAAVCLEIIDRINARSFEIAHAVMHTSGQAFVMSFQAGGTHAQDRALEAVAYAYAEQTRHADTAVWEKPQGKRPALRMEKTFTPGDRGARLLHPQRGPLALRLLPHRGVGVPGLLGVGVGDRLQRPVLRVRAAGLERHDERLAAGVHDRVRDLEAAGVDPVDDLQAHRRADPRARRPPAGGRCGGRGDQRVRAQMLVADAQVQAVRRDLATGLPVRPGLAQAERLAQ